MPWESLGRRPYVTTGPTVLYLNNSERVRASGFNFCGFVWLVFFFFFLWQRSSYHFNLGITDVSILKIKIIMNN